MNSRKDHLPLALGIMERNWDVISKSGDSILYQFKTTVKLISSLICNVLLSYYSSYSSAMQRQMIVLAYSGSRCTQFHAAGWMFGFFYVILFWVAYLAWWDFAMDPTKERHQILRKFRKKEKWGLWLDKRSGKNAWAVHGCLNGILGIREEQSRAWSLFSSRQAKRSIPHTIVTL
jgi:hypothetical protein